MTAQASPCRILVLCPPVADYLAVTVLHGLRAILGNRVVDWPRYGPAYRDFPETKRRGTYGLGFSVFYDLEEGGGDRKGIEERLIGKEFDLIIISDIWRLHVLYKKWRKYFNPDNTIIIDGADSPQVYPHAGLWWRNPRLWMSPKADAGFLYFKREWTHCSQFNIWHRLLPNSLQRRLKSYSRMRPISFSIPETKITKKLPAKSKNFTRHIVDPEVAQKIHGASTVYAFDNEHSYYSDLQSSRFGITMKRAGWDCLRHYEIAANGCVPCFKSLNDKPLSCAPHGLVGGVNCVIYKTSDDLFKQVQEISESKYSILARGAIEWAKDHTTERVACSVLDEYRKLRLLDDGLR